MAVKKVEPTVAEQFDTELRGFVESVAHLREVFPGLSPAFQQAVLDGLIRLRKPLRQLKLLARV